METQCTQRSFGFHPLGRRDVVARFDGGRVTSDGGGILLRQIEERFGFIERFATCFSDYRNPEWIEHPLADLLKQRLFGKRNGVRETKRCQVHFRLGETKRCQVHFRLEGSGYCAFASASADDTRRTGEAVEEAATSGLTGFERGLLIFESVLPAPGAIPTAWALTGGASCRRRRNPWRGRGSAEPFAGRFRRGARSHFPVIARRSSGGIGSIVCSSAQV